MRVGILGGGIGGLSSGYFLSKYHDNLEIYEAASYTGGLARSFRWHDFDCDIGPHRFYTTEPDLLEEVKSLVQMNKVVRNTAIFVRGKWISDPVNAVEVVLKFFPQPSIDIVWNYLFKKKRPETHFENMVLNQFGKGLNDFFFKPYSEKLFGIPSSEISPEWGRAKLRVSGLRDLIERKSKLYFRDYWYPKNGGYGSFGETFSQRLEHSIHRDHRLTDIAKNQDGPYHCKFETENRIVEEQFDHIISTIPITLLANMLGKEVALRFKGSSIYYFHLKKPFMTKNQWFYVADEKYSINRVAEFKNFLGEGQPTDETVVGAEVTREGSTVESVTAELISMGLLMEEDILDTKIVQLPGVYPVYDIGYETKIAELEEFFKGHPNITLVGRQGNFRHVDIDDILLEARDKVEALQSRLK